MKTEVHHGMKPLGLRWRSGHAVRSPFTSEVAGAILSENFPKVTRAECPTHAKSVSQHSAESRGFLRALRFPPTGKLTGWVRLNTDREVKSQLL